jgi:hypothetical protein
MSNRTDWDVLAEEILTDYYGNTEEARSERLKKRIETELHDAFVAGQEDEMGFDFPGYPIYFSANDRVVLDIRNDLDLSVVKSILKARDEAKAKLEGVGQ